MKCLIHRDIVAHTAQLFGTGQSGGTTAHHGHFLTFSNRGFLCHDFVFHRPVTDETLQFADGHGVTLAAKDTLALALALLRAHATAHRRQRGVLTNQSGGFVELSVLDQRDEVRNADMHRAAAHTLRVLAGQTSASLFHRLFGIVAETNLPKI